MPSTQGAAVALTNSKKSRESYLLPETVAQEDGFGPVVPAECDATRLTLGITTALEQEQLEVSVWASSDGEHWGDKPVARFRRKSYCGMYNLPLDLSRLSGVRHLRVGWQMSRWGGDREHPLFGFYVAMA